MKKTLVLGASAKPERYSYMATVKLKLYGHEVIAIGNRVGMIESTPIITHHPVEEGIDTVTLYLSAKFQKQYYPYLLSLKPKRILFNPGTENPELVELAKANGIEAVEACTLVLLGNGLY